MRFTTDSTATLGVKVVRVRNGAELGEAVSEVALKVVCEEENQPTKGRKKEGEDEREMDSGSIGSLATSYFPPSCRRPP
jgi:hypothetical protein